MSMIKYLLFLFNVLCLICGVLLIVFGALLFSSIHSFDDFAEALKTQQIPVTMIVLGSVIVLISFIGCCGAVRESYCLSMVYSALLFVLMVAQLALVAYIWLQKDEYLIYMGDVVEKAWQRRTQKADYMDAFQISMECCGKDSFLDYTSHGYFLPQSCCKDTRFGERCGLDNVYRVGCKRAFVNFWDKNSDIIKYTGLIIAAIEFVGFVFACCLANNIRNYRRRSAY